MCVGGQAWSGNHLQPWNPPISAHHCLHLAGPKADADAGDLARVFLLSERRGDPGTDNSRRWQIEALSEKSAEEELEERINAGDWPAALDLAREHCLSTDPVHKCDPHLLWVELGRSDQIPQDTSEGLVHLSTQACVMVS